VLAKKKISCTTIVIVKVNLFMITKTILSVGIVVKQHYKVVCWTKIRNLKFEKPKNGF